MAWELCCGIHAKVKVRRQAFPGDSRKKLVESTVGRFIFVGIQDMGFVNRDEDPYSSG